MMETFIVLGLCFILYEALDFFQGCIHSATPSASDQIDAYRRQLDEQRQQQQQEQFLANISPLLGAQFAALAGGAGGSLTSTATATSTTASTASVISELRAAVFGGEHETPYSLSTPALNARGAAGGTGAYGFRPAHRSIYESQELHATSSLPRDYYYLQQQQLKNKNSSKPLLAKFTNTSDNRIHPESASVLGVPSGVITTQPLSSTAGSTFDCQPPVLLPAVPLGLDLKRAILSNSNNNNEHNLHNNSNDKHAHNELVGECGEIETVCLAAEQRARRLRPGAAVAVKSLPESDTEDCESVSGVSVASTCSSSSPSESLSAASASLASASYATDEQEAADDRELNIGSCSSSHADFREIECERLRRKCVSVKRIYSISEKF